MKKVPAHLQPALWSQILIYGLVPGIILGLMFKTVEFYQFTRVYTLLLNVDFIPGFQKDLPEWFEFSLHLAVSLGLGAAFAVLLRRYSRPWLPGLLLGLVPVPLFVPLTLLSARTPELSDGAALVWWVAGHLIYGLLLGLLGRIMSGPRK
ncbi:hypothetical protein [Paenibacillus lutrae]|uniref:Uncharacterized protein n=1 Tax=Paenibacillus lutrae TaxID=2078573 RepID=A0A7X3FFT3_9BACL|nr:hypothetical protein [Paenibacillus lutrae]MVO98698.1 hypothetical protein [Paenibacillus lutrae]